MELSENARIVSIALLVVAVLAIIIGPKHNGIPIVIAICLLLADIALLAWARSRRSP
jgi:hypothetical protein